MKKYLLLGLSLILFVSGCGYSMRSTLPTRLQNVYVEPFENQIQYTTNDMNQTYFPLLEVKTRNAVADRFLFDGRLKVAAEPENADLKLKGVLKSYEKRALRYEDNDDVQEYRVYVTVALEMVDQANKTVMWAEPALTGEATYYLTGSQARSEEAAVDEAILDLAKRTVERTIEDW